MLVLSCLTIHHFIEEEKQRILSFSWICIENTHANIVNSLQQPEIENYTKPNKSENKLFVCAQAHTIPSKVHILNNNPSRSHKSLNVVLYPKRNIKKRRHKNVASHRLQHYNKFYSYM